MFARLERPFLTDVTGEAYQPVRLNYETLQPDAFVQALEKLACITKNTLSNSWSWFWTGECDEQHFDSVDSFKRNPTRPVRLGTITLRGNKISISLPSFKRACLAIPFFYRMIPDQNIFKIMSADFINKVFALDERLPHGFTELFKENELDNIMQQRIEDYEKINKRSKQAATPEDAFQILSEYSDAEAKKRLPYVERYVFELTGDEDMEIVFLAFYIYLRGRELVAIKRWFGQTGYTLADVADETVAQVFGDVGFVEE